MLSSFLSVNKKIVACFGILTSFYWSWYIVTCLQVIYKALKQHKFLSYIMCIKGYQHFQTTWKHVDSKKMSNTSSALLNISCFNKDVCWTWIHSIIWIPEEVEKSVLYMYDLYVSFLYYTKSS